VFLHTWTGLRWADPFAPVRRIRPREEWLSRLTDVARPPATRRPSGLCVHDADVTMTAEVLLSVLKELLNATEELVVDE
jgi:hypothetical protein